ncbi:nuclear transport factor 2 family protein [Altererythrobacter sp.]|nr:nuclear transport factor 2 family protein [Altererythrobacter sp.]
MADQMSATELAAKLFGAFESGDMEAARSCCARDFRGSQNGGPWMDLDKLLRFSSAVKKAVPDFRYEEITRSATATGFVEEHAVRGTLPNGSKLDLMLCVVAEVRGGKITELREYLDSRAGAGLFKALSGAD